MIVADVLRVVPGCEIDLDELEWKFTASGGPGGQHANRSNTRVEVRFDIAASPSLTDEQRVRLRAKVGDVVRVVADDERSQARNRAVALDRLRSRLAEALYVPRARRPTKKSKSAQERRLQDKREQSERKAARRAPRRDDF
jgi:ribosome-associated protein